MAAARVYGTLLRLVNQLSSTGSRESAVASGKRLPRSSPILATIPPSDPCSISRVFSNCFRIKVILPNFLLFYYLYRGFNTIKVRQYSFIFLQTLSFLLRNNCFSIFSSRIASLPFPFEISIFRSRRIGRRKLESSDSEWNRLSGTRSRSFQPSPWRWITASFPLHN